jgi:electron transfer flavoprotein alpha/beta subunit
LFAIWVATGSIMDIGVCVKIIPDPSVVLLDEKHRLDPNDRVYMINPCDLVALEEALRLKDAGCADKITVVSIAPPESEGVLRRCLALGAARAVRLWDNAFNKLYNDAVGITLAHILGQCSLDLVFCGNQAADDEMGYTGYLVAEALGVPFIQHAVQIDVPKNNRMVITAKRAEGKREKIEAGFPVVVGIADNLNEPRYATLPALMTAFRSRVETVDLKAIGLSEIDVRSKIKLVGLSPPRFRSKKIFIPDSNLSASDRLRQIMSGGITEKKEVLHEDSPETLSQKFVQYLNQLDAR